MGKKLPAFSYGLGSADHHTLDVNEFLRETSPLTRIFGQRAAKFPCKYANNGECSRLVAIRVSESLYFNRK